MRQILFIVIDSSDTSPSQSFTAEDMWNRDEQLGRKPASFHYFIERDGTINHGIPEYAAAEHDPRTDSRAIYITLAGDGRYEINQFSALKNLLTSLKRKYHNARIGGMDSFREGITRPGFNVKIWSARYGHFGLV